MANVINKTTNQFKRSAHTPDFLNGQWLIDPDVSDLEKRNVPERYWKVKGNSIVEMTTPEKAVVDAASVDPNYALAITKLKKGIGLTDAELRALGL